MKKLRLTIGLFFCLLGIAIAISGCIFFATVPNQEIADKKFKEEFSPIISYIETFNVQNRRYPNEVEFENWKTRNGLENRAIFLFQGITPEELKEQIKTNTHYIISMWRGEWDVFYIAQEKRFFPGDYGYIDALIQFFKTAIIGGFLFLIGYLLITLHSQDQDQFGQ